MKKLRIYLDTSVINFLFADDAPEERDITKKFFRDWVTPKVVETHVSPVVVNEIMKTADLERRGELLDVVKRHELVVLALTPEAEIRSLAQLLVTEGAIPRKKQDDAMHVAFSVVYEMDVLVSWNFEHLANVNKERRIAAICQTQGYFYPLRITTPLEVMGK